MVFPYDKDEPPLTNAKRYVWYIIQTIQNHPENARLERIENDLKKLLKILDEINTIKV